jgi:hypothetical protein
MMECRMPVTFDIRVYDVVKNTDTLHQSICDVLGSPDVEILIDKHTRPYSLTESQMFIKDDVDEYIRARNECGQIAVIVLVEINRQNDFNDAMHRLAAECITKFPDFPFALFIISAKGEISVLTTNHDAIRAQYQQILVDTKTIEGEEAASANRYEPETVDEPGTLDESVVELNENGATSQEPGSILISFMGDASTYKPITHQDQSGSFSYDTCFSAHYAYKKYRLRKAIILCTKGVIGYFKVNLKGEVCNPNNLNDPDFSNTFTAEEYTDPAVSNMDIWHLVTIFDKILDKYNITSTEKIILDVTHGYRIIPMFVISLFRYLTVIKGFKPDNVTIIYANYRDGVSNCIVHELDVFRRMDGWTDAAKSVVNHGNARDMVTLLRAYQSSITNSSLATSIKQLADKLDKWVEIVQLTLWVDYPHVFRELNNCINTVRAASVDPEVKYVLQWIQTQFADVFVLTEINPCMPTHELQIQEFMMKWYLSCQMYTQAALLTREYLISKYLICHGTWHKKNSKWLSLKPCDWKKKRIRLGGEDTRAKHHYMPIWLNVIYTNDKLGEKVEIVRNAVAHGFNDTNSNSIIQIVDQAITYDICGITTAEDEAILDLLQSGR